MCVLSFVLVTRYIFIVLEIILTLCKYDRTYFIVYVLFNILLRSSRKLASIYSRDDRHGELYLLIW